MIHLTYADLLYVAEGGDRGAAVVRDAGLLEAAAARPHATVFGQDAYQTLEDKAAALTHSIARNHALMDVRKAAALGGPIAFLWCQADAASP